MKGSLASFLLLVHLAYFVIAILQRVLSASVTVDKQLISSIGKGVLVFAAVAPNDTDKDAEALAAKVILLAFICAIKINMLGLKNEVMG